MAPRALRHHQRKNIFIFANQENLRIFLICFFHGKSCFLCRKRSRGTGLRAFIKFFSAGYVLFCVPKENQKGRRCPQGMKAPVGLLSRRPVCAANAACSARQGLCYFRGAGGGGLRRVAAPCVSFVPCAVLASCRPLPQQLLPVSAAGRGRRRCKLGATRP